MGSCICYNKYLAIHGICYYNNIMEIEFDPAKDEANQAKHGMSLDLAKVIDLQTAVIRLDDRRAYGEDRFRAYGSIDGRLCMLVFTLRGSKVRPISLRKANRMEVRRYGKDQA